MLKTVESNLTSGEEESCQITRKGSAKNREAKELSRIRRTGKGREKGNRKRVQTKNGESSSRGCDDVRTTSEEKDRCVAERELKEK